MVVVEVVVGIGRRVVVVVVVVVLGGLIFIVVDRVVKGALVVLNLGGMGVVNVSPPPASSLPPASSPCSIGMSRWHVIKGLKCIQLVYHKI